MKRSRKELDCVAVDVLYLIGKKLYKSMDASTSRRDEWADFVHFALLNHALYKRFKSRLRGLIECLSWCAVCVVRPADNPLNCLSVASDRCRIPKARREAMRDEDCSLMNICDACAVDVCVDCGAGHCGCAEDHYTQCKQSGRTYCTDCASNHIV